MAKANIVNISISRFDIYLIFGTSVLKLGFHDNPRASNLFKCLEILCAGSVGRLKCDGKFG